MRRSRRKFTGCGKSSLKSLFSGLTFLCFTLIIWLISSEALLTVENADAPVRINKLYYVFKASVYRQTRAKSEPYQKNILCNTSSCKNTRGELLY